MRKIFLSIRILQNVCIFFIVFGFTFRCSATVGDPFTLVGATNGSHGTPGINIGPFGYYYLVSNVRHFKAGNATGTYTLGANTSYDLDAIVAAGYLLPLVVPEGVTISGNFDINTPGGTSITTTNRTPWIASYSCPGADLFCEGNELNLYMIQMEPGNSMNHTTIEGVQLHGGSPDWQDDNDGDIATSITYTDHRHFLCGGIYLNHSSTSGHSQYFDIINCEIADFNVAGIWPASGTSDVEISNCYIHHIGGALRSNPFDFNPGIGYGIYVKETSEATFNLHNNIYDECKEAIDWNTQNGSLSISESTLLNGVNAHAGNETFQHPGTGTVDCSFWQRNYPDINSICLDADQTYEVTDCGGGNFFFDQNFLRSNISIPYPYSNLGAKNITSPIWVTPPGGRNILQNSGYTASFYDGTLTGGGWEVPIPFSDPFPFYGNYYQYCYVSTNGFIQFAPGSGDLAINTTTALPNTNAPNNMVALCWSHLAPGNSSEISWWYDNGGTGALVILYSAVPFYANGGILTAELLIYPNGKIEMSYQDQTNSADMKVMGLENYNGTEYASNTPVTFNNANWSISTDEEWRFLPRTYEARITNNTFSMDHDSPDDQACNPVSGGIGNPNHGYATVADNYIENCTWLSDYNISSTGNSFNYSPGVVVSGSSPQPPEFILDLKDGSGNTLPETINESSTLGHGRIQYLPVGSAFQISATSQTTDDYAYIIRTNPSIYNNVQHASPNTNIFEIHNDSYREEIKRPASSQSEVLESFSYQDGSNNDLPGLFGIDVLAVNPDNNSASQWQHIPLIIVPNDEQHLIFNIKDTYHDFHNNIVCNCAIPTATHVLKEARLNGFVIWAEDIADGGDGWERIDIDLTGYLYNSTTEKIFSKIFTDGTNNTLTFDIAIENNAQVLINEVKGVSVFIDDVYLKKYGSTTGENLIQNGDIEGCNDIGNGGCSWFIPSSNQQITMCTTVITTPSPPGLHESDETETSFDIISDPEQTAIVPISTTTTYPFRGEAGTGRAERKSGQKALIISMDRIYDPRSEGNAGVTNSSDCDYTDYYYPSAISNGDPIAWVGTEIDFRGLLSCDDYGDVTNGFNPVTLSCSNCSGLHEAELLIIDHSINITNGNTLDLKGSTVVISPDVSITIEDGGELYIHSDASLRAPILFSCEQMWQGIVVDPGGTLEINSNNANNKCKISNALIAVNAIDNDVSSNPTVHVRYCEFDQNNISIFLSSGDFPFGTNDDHTSIRGSAFKCTGKLISMHTTSNHDEDYYGLPSYAHIVVNYATAQIGDPSDIDYKNYFYDGNIGILGLWSSLEVYQNKFDDIGNVLTDAYPSAGVAMLGETDDASSLLIVGPTTTATGYFTNEFVNCKQGILASGEVTSYIYGNNLTGCERGIDIWLDHSKEVHVVENTIDNCMTAISFIELDSDIPDLTVNKNILTGGLISGAPANQIGICFFNSFVQYVPMECNENEITDYPIGIYLTNLSSGGKFEILSNIIDFNTDEGKLGAIHLRGIDLTNCRNVEIGNNTIEWQNSLSASGINSYASQVQGIRVDGLTGSTIHSNTITRCGTGMYMDNSCTGTYFKCNYFDNNYPGIDFALTTGLPAQGGTGDPAYNTWNIDYANWGKIAGNPDGFNYHYSGSTSNSNPEYPHPQLTLNRVSTATSQFECGGQGGNLMASEDPENKNKELNQIVDNPETLEGDYAEQAEYFMQEYAFGMMTQIPELINTEARSDFMNSTEENNIGKLQEVAELTDAGDIEEASINNNLIVETNLIEENKKIVNSVLLAAALRNDTLTQSDSTALNVIAHLPAKTGGEGVYWARGKLRLIIEDELSALRKSKSQLEKSLNSNQGRLSPVPAKDRVTYEYTHDQSKIIKIVVINIVGAVMLDISLDKTFLEFSVSNWAPGFYSLITFADGVMIEEHKLSVIK